MTKVVTTAPSASHVFDTCRPTEEEEEEEEMDDEEAMQRNTYAVAHLLCSHYGALSLHAGSCWRS